MAALLFRYREAMDRDLPWLVNVQRSKKPSRLPMVTTFNEFPCLLGGMAGRANS